MGILTSPLDVLDAVFAPKLNAVRAGAEAAAVGNPTREQLLARIKDVQEERSFVRDRRTARMSFAFTERERTLFTHAFLELPTPRAAGEPSIMTLAEFEECWVAARGWKPSQSVLDTMASLFPSGKLDVVEFTRSCALDTVEVDRVPFAVSFVQEERSRYDGLVELLFYVPFLVLLTYILLSMREMPASFQLFQGVADNIVERRFTEPCSGLECTQRAPRVLTYRTVSEPAYFYEWLRAQVVPTLWSGADNERADTLTNQRFVGIGALHLQQQRVAPVLAAGNYDVRRRYTQFFVDPEPTPAQREYIAQFYNSSTSEQLYEYPQGSDDGMTDKPFRQADLAADSTISQNVRAGFNFSAGAACSSTIRGFLSDYDCSGYTLDIPLSLTKAQAIELVNQLERLKWLDRASRFVAVRMVVFQRDTQVFGRIVAGYEIATGGQWLPALRAHMFRYFSFSQQSIVWIFFFMLFLGWLGWNIVSFLIALFDVVRTAAFSLGRPFHSAFDHGICNFFYDFVFMVFPRALVKAYANDGWLFIDSCNYTVFVIVWFWRARAWTNYSGFDVWNNAQYPRDIENYAMNTSEIDYVESINIVLSFMRLLKNLRVFPVLRLIYQTIAAASVDLYGMAFTAFVLFVAFSLSGFVAYGALLPEFSTIVRAITTILRFVIGDYDYGAWEDAQAIMSPFYYAMLQIMLVVIVLEFITAIIADTFSDITEAQYRTDYIRNIIEADLRSVLTADAIDTPKRHPIVLELTGGIWSVVSFVKYFAYLCQEGVHWCRECCMTAEERAAAEQKRAEEVAARRAKRQVETQEERNERYKNRILNDPPVDSALWIIQECQRKPKRLFGYMEALVRRMYFRSDAEAAEALLLLYEIIFEMESSDDVRESVSRQLAFTLAASHLDTSRLTNNLPAEPRHLLGQLVSRLGMHHYPFLVTVGVHMPHAMSRLPRVSRFVSLFEAHATWSTTMRSQSVTQYEDAQAFEKLGRMKRTVRLLSSEPLSSDDEGDNDSGAASLDASGELGAVPANAKSVQDFDSALQELTAAHDSHLDDGNRERMQAAVQAIMAAQAAAHKLAAQAHGAAPAAARAVDAGGGDDDQNDGGNAELLAGDKTFEATELEILESLRVRAAFAGIYREHVDMLFNDWELITDRTVKVARIEAYRAKWLAVRGKWAEEFGTDASFNLDDEEELIFGPRPSAAAPATTAAVVDTNHAGAPDTSAAPGQEMTSLAAIAGSDAKHAFDAVAFFDYVHKHGELAKLRAELTRTVMTQGWTERKKKAFGLLLQKVAVKYEEHRAGTAPASTAAPAAATTTTTTTSVARKLVADDGSNTNNAPDTAAAAPAAAAAATATTTTASSALPPFDPAHLSYRIFSDMWTRIVGAAPSSALEQGVRELSHMENGEQGGDDDKVTLNAHKFAKFCVISTEAHSRTSIHSFFFEVMHEKMFNTVQLILYLPFVALFTLLLLLQQNNLGTYASYSVKSYVTRPYKSPDMRPFALTTTQDQWRNWMDQSVFGNLLGTTAGAPYFDFPGTSFLVGGIRVRQFRTRAVENCGFPADAEYGTVRSAVNLTDSFYTARLKSHFQEWCVPRWPIGREETEDIVASGSSVASSASAQVRSAFRYASCPGNSLAFQEGLTGYFRTCGGYTLFFPANQTRADALAVLDEALPSWLDVSTRALVTDFFVYNFNDNIFVRTMVLAEVGAGGGWSFRIKQDPFRLFTFAPIGDASKTYIIVMVFFLTVYAIAFLVFIVGTVHDARHIRHRRSCTYLSALGEIASNMWWTVEFVIYMLMAAAWLTRFFFMSASADDVRMYVNEFPERLLSYAEAAFAISVIESVNTFFIYVRIFYFVRLHARLNVLPKTLEKAAGYMLSILIISIIVLLAFGLAGHVVYGPSVLSMSSVGSSLRTLTLTIFENGDYENWLRDKPVWTVVYYALFTFICVQILFNMITSVLARAYSDAKDERFNPSELQHAASVDSTMLGSPDVFPAIVVQELRYRLFGPVRAWQRWRGDKLATRKRHNDVLRNPYTFFRFMDEATTLVEQGSPRQQCIAAGNVLVTIALLREANKSDARAQAMWRRAVAASSTRQQIYGIPRNTMLQYVSDQLPENAFNHIYFWCLAMPMAFLGVSPAEAAQDLLEAHAVWHLSASKYLELDGGGAPSNRDEREEELGKMLGSITKSTYAIIGDYKKRR